MEKILITGALGFIGSHLIDLFQKKGYRLAVLDVPPRPLYFSKDIEYIQGSVTDKSAWQAALKGVDRVVHLAAYQGYQNDFSTYITVNASGTALLYEVIAAEKFPVQQVIFASSESVYGEGKYRCKEHGVFYPELRSVIQLQAHEWDIRCPKDNSVAEVLPSEEGDVMMPASPYAVSKAAADHAARLLGRACGIPTTILRFAMVYGAHDSMRELYAKSLNYFAEKALKKEEIPIHEDGNQLRDLVDVRDVGKAIGAVLGNEKAYYQIFNIGTGRSVSLRAVAEAVCAAVGAPFKPVFPGEFRNFTPRNWVMSVEKAKEIPWEPKYSLEESVGKFVEIARKFYANP